MTGLTSSAEAVPLEHIDAKISGTVTGSDLDQRLALSGGTNDKDSDSMSVDGTNNVIDVSTAGYYLIFGACEVQSLADGDQVRLRVLDGTTRIGRMDQVVGAAASVVLQVHCVASLASGASIAVEVLTATGSTNTGTEQSHFTMVRVN